MGYVTGEVSAADAAAIDGMLAAAARSLGAEDPRTEQQRRSDLFADLLLGRLHLTDPDEDQTSHAATSQDPPTATCSAALPTRHAAQLYRRRRAAQLAGGRRHRSGHRRAARHPSAADRRRRRSRSVSRSIRRTEPAARLAPDGHQDDPGNSDRRRRAAVQPARSERCSRRAGRSLGFDPGSGAARGHRRRPRWPAAGMKWSSPGCSPTTAAADGHHRTRTVPLRKAGPGDPGPRRNMPLPLLQRPRRPLRS